MLMLMLMGFIKYEGDVGLELDWRVFIFGVFLFLVFMSSQYSWGYLGVGQSWSICVIPDDFVLLCFHLRSGSNPGTYSSTW